MTCKPLLLEILRSRCLRVTGDYRTEELINVEGRVERKQRGRGLGEEVGVKAPRL